MKPAQEVDGTLSVARRIVIAAVIGGIAGAAVGWYLQQGGRSVIGLETGLAVSVLLFTMSIGTCIGGAFGVIVAEGRSVIRASQQFRPGANLSLEGRIALSSFGHPMKAEHAVVAQTAAIPPILGIFQREATGLTDGGPVYERWTTTFYNGLTQTDNETFVYNHETVTVTENLALPGTAGSETGVDHFTAIPGGILYTNTVTEPNGQTETETLVDTFVGAHKIIYNGSFEVPDGVTITFTGNSVQTGARTVVNKSFHESNGISYTTHEVDISQGEWQSSATVTTKWLDGSHQVDKSTVSGVMLTSPPS